MRGIFTFLFLCTFFFCPVLSEGESPPDFAKTYSEYLRLRTGDTGFKNYTEWEKVGDQFVQYASFHKESSQADRSLFLAARMYERLFRRLGGDDRLFRAKSLYQRIYERYPRSRFADDALFRKAVLLEDTEKSFWKAKELYEQIVKYYSDSDHYVAANENLSRFSENTITGLKSKPLERKKPLVILDPGHGGEDLGGEGGSGLVEKNLVLQIARELKQVLESSLDIEVRLTRDTDIFIPLEDRTAFANKLGADLFVSLHTNASPRKKLSGFETYYLDNTGDKSSRKLAERENQSGGKSSQELSDLQFILSDLIQSGKLDESIVLANLIQEGAVQTIRKQWGELKDLGVKKAPFYVLVGAHMPCVLVEMFFIDHKKDGKWLAMPRFRSDLAEGIASGIGEYLKREGLL